jgi:hypothetical protein
MSRQMIERYLTLAGIPRGPKSQWFLVDPVNGKDNYNGVSFKTPLQTLEEAENRCVANQHDTVIMLSGATADNPTASIAWDKSYTHLIGFSSNLHGVGQRSRIVGTSTLDLTPVITFSGDGCIVKNLQIYNGKDADTDSGAAVVSGSRNEFENVFFAGMAHATPAARAGSYSLKLTGSENLFKRCAIGLDTVLRAAANPELWVSGSAARNAFLRSRFLSYSETAGKHLVLIDGMDRWIEFEDCIFQNFSVNWANTLTNAFVVSASATHDIIFRGQNQLKGFSGWGDVVSHMYNAAPVPAAGFGVSTQPTT